MPILSHKSSKAKLRRPPGLTLHDDGGAAGLPTPPPTAESTFRFWRKGSSSSASSASSVGSSSPAPSGPSTAPLPRAMPKPILRQPSDECRGPSIRIATARGEVGPGLRSAESAYDSPHPMQAQQAAAARQLEAMRSHHAQVHEAQRQYEAGQRQRAEQQQYEHGQQQYGQRDAQQPYQPQRQQSAPPQLSPIRRVPDLVVSFSDSAVAPARAPAPTQPRMVSTRRSSRSPQPTLARAPPAPVAPAFAAAAYATPPPAHARTMPAPPSPYRETAERARVSPVPAPSMPFSIDSAGSAGGSATAPGPPRHSSLFRAESRSSRRSSRSSMMTAREAQRASVVSVVSVATLRGTDAAGVPVFNIIPATPQEHADEFAPRPARQEGDVEEVGLDEAIEIDGGEGEGARHDVRVELAAVDDGDDRDADADDADMRAVELGAAATPPVLDLKLDFSPFEPLVSLPSASTLSLDTIDADVLGGTLFASPDVYAAPCAAPAPASGYAYEYGYGTGSEAGAPTDPLPPSPPFESFPSLPSLASMPSSASQSSMQTSYSALSLSSFPDVEEELGSMLRSLSDPAALGVAGNAATPSTGADKRASRAADDVRVNLASVESMDNAFAAAAEADGNPGLGLGLGLEFALDLALAPHKVTAPLAPRRRASPPAPLDLARAKAGAASASVEPAFRSAPPVIDHRVAFYTTRASPTSSAASSSSSLAPAARGAKHRHSYSFGAANDCDSDGLDDDDDDYDDDSDSDLHTASIISVTPVLGSRPFVVEVDEVGLAL
ncbi:hypothetical protein Q5752_003079 [Cryptotrichosporon argae]